jgi:hypothetical protein
MSSYISSEGLLALYKGIYTIHYGIEPDWSIAERLKGLSPDLAFDDIYG